MARDILQIQKVKESIFIIDLTLFVTKLAFFLDLAQSK